jgi:hypothetical protein
MGVFDTYGERQMKIGEPWCKYFKVGDNVSVSEVDDGVYIDDDGKAIVIKGKIFIGEFDCFDCYGDKYNFEVEKQL